MQKSTASNHLIDIPYFRFRIRFWVLILSFGIIGFIAPMIYGYVRGFPIPSAHDELSYTVAADTYASGRITNPTPALFEHFETPHVLMEPSYISKYPPMQGLFMAAGQVLFGYQIFGVWLSCGFMAAALFWMLSAWTRPKWAICGTVLMILFIGVDSYWAQSYWGGMAAALGGALFFGGFRRIFKKLSFRSTVVMTLGGIIMINARPFEGTLTMLPSLAFLLGWLLQNKTNCLSKKLTQVVFPGIIVASIGLSAMFYQYYRVTGNPFTLPYLAHQSQYYPAPIFIFQSVNTSATKGNERIRKVYDNYTEPPVLKHLLRIESLPDSIYLSPVYGIIYLLVAIPLFFLSPFLAILLYCTIPLIIKRSRWLLLISVTILFTFACMCLGVWWDQYHYCAPLTSCFFLLVTEGLRQFYVSSKTVKERRFVLTALFGLIVGSFIFLQLCSYQHPRLEKDFSADRRLIFERLSENKPVAIDVPKRAAFFKSEFEEIVKNTSDKYIAVVAYDKGYDFHDEIVYNKSDIRNAQLIWAHDLGDEKNQKLFKEYGNRKIVMIKIANPQIEITPLADLSR